MVKATLRKSGDKTPAQAAAAALKSDTPVIDVDASVTPASNDELRNALGVNDAAEDAGATAQEQTSAIVKAAPKAVSRYSTVSDGGFGGEWSKDDLKFPNLKIIQGSGPLSNLFKTGQVILGDEVVLNDPDPNGKPPFIPTMQFIPISLIKRWRENISKEEYAAGKFPRVVDTESEVEELGGTTQWIGRGPGAQRPSWSPSVTCLLLVERPEGSQHPNFAIELNGKFYAPCVYYATGTGFTYFAKPVFNAQLSLQIEVGKDEKGRPIKKTYVPKNVWTWETKKVKAGDNFVFAPVVRMTPQQTTDEVRTFLKEITVTDEQVAAED